MISKNAKGFSLIEVLVAVLVFAIGVLGAAAMQMNALKFNQTASVRSQSTLLAYEIADAMRANRELALAGSYDLDLESPAPSGTAINAVDLRTWRQTLANRLPLGTGSVARNGNTFTITVQWDQSRLGAPDDPDTADVDESLGTFVFVTDL